MKAHFIFEKFQEQSDPIHDMGIGYKEKIDMEVLCTTHAKKFNKEKRKLLKIMESSLQKELSEKFVGKIVTGDFFTEYKEMTRSLLIKSVEVVVDLDYGYVRELIVTSNKGRKYNMNTSSWGEQEYVITAK